MKCAVCGTELAESSRFCSRCGAQVGAPDLGRRRRSDVQGKVSKLTRAEPSQGPSDFLSPSWLHDNEKVIGWSTAAVCITTFLPWASVFGFSVIGVKTGGGVLTLLLGLTGLGALAAHVGMGPFRPSQRTFLIIQLVAAAVSLLIMFGNLVNAGGFAGVGLILGFIASIVWAAFSVRAWQAQSADGSEAV